MMQNQRLQQIDTYIYQPEEIKNFRLDEAVNEHPLKRRPINLRSRLAYREILINTKATTKYILPGSMVVFNYPNPKFAEDLEWYDKTPHVIMFGLTKDKKNNIISCSSMNQSIKLTDTSIGQYLRDYVRSIR